MQQVDLTFTPIVFSALASHLLQKAKNSRFVPWIKQEALKVNRAIAASGLAAGCVHLSQRHRVCEPDPIKFFLRIRPCPGGCDWCPEGSGCV
jgi:hypothetical protein